MKNLFLILTVISFAISGLSFAEDEKVWEVILEAEDGSLKKCKNTEISHKVEPGKTAKKGSLVLYKGKQYIVEDIQGNFVELKDKDKKIKDTIITKVDKIIHLTENPPGVRDDVICKDGKRYTVLSYILDPKKKEECEKGEKEDPKVVVAVKLKELLLKPKDRFYDVRYNVTGTVVKVLNGKEVIVKPDNNPFQNFKVQRANLYKGVNSFQRFSVNQVLRHPRGRNFKISKIFVSPEGDKAKAFIFWQGYPARDIIDLDKLVIK